MFRFCRVNNSDHEYRVCFGGDGPTNLQVPGHDFRTRESVKTSGYLYTSRVAERQKAVFNEPEPLVNSGALRYDLRGTRGSERKFFAGHCRAVQRAGIACRRQ